MDKTVILIRGTSGSGKTTFANYLYSIMRDNKSVIVCSADDYMINKDGKYEFNPLKLGYCHNSCKTKFENALMDKVDLVIVSNTNTTEKEINPYIELGNAHGYNIFSIVMENRHGGVNEHGVNIETLNKQANKIRNSLKLI